MLLLARFEGGFMDSNCIDYIFKNVELTIPIVVFIGYISASIQKIVRLAYYKVDIVYLFSLHISEIFLGIGYLLLLCLPFYSACLYNLGSKCVCVISVLCSIVLIFLQIYSLKLVFNKKFLLTLLAYLIFYFLVLWVAPVHIDVVIQTVKILTIQQFALYFLFVFLLFIILVIALQFWAEYTNERFTYLITESSEVYVFITTFQGNFITVHAAISDDSRVKKIKIYRGEIVLFPIDKYKINVFFSDSKVLV